MFFAIIANDGPGKAEARQATRSAHMLHLDRGSPDVRVLQSGPLLGTDGETVGSLIIVQSESFQAVRQFADGDPYNQAGIFASINVHPWAWRRGNPYLERQ